MASVTLAAAVVRGGEGMGWEGYDVIFWMEWGSYYTSAGELRVGAVSKWSRPLSQACVKPFLFSPHMRYCRLSLRQVPKYITFFNKFHLVSKSVEPLCYLSR